MTSTKYHKIILLFICGTKLMCIGNHMYLNAIKEYSQVIAEAKPSAILTVTSKIVL